MFNLKDRVAIVSGASQGIGREPLVRPVCLPALWHESVREMIDNGVTIFAEAGPGRVLSGLLRQIDSSVRCLNVEDSASLHSTAERVAQARAEAPER